MTGHYSVHYLLRLKREDLDAFRAHTKRRGMSMAEVLRAHICALTAREGRDTQEKKKSVRAPLLGGGRGPQERQTTHENSSTGE